MGKSFTIFSVLIALYINEKRRAIKLPEGMFKKEII